MSDDLMALASRLYDAYRTANDDGEYQNVFWNDLDADERSAWANVAAAAMEG